MTDLTGGVEERAANQPATITWFRERDYEFLLRSTP
jgi:hypothetical protein